MHRARLWIVCAINQAPNSCMNQRSRAHRARLNCSKQLTVAQAVLADGSARFAQGNHLRVGSGIGVADIAIETAANDFSLIDNHSADGNFSSIEGAPGSAQRV